MVKNFNFNSDGNVGQRRDLYTCLKVIDSLAILAINDSASFIEYWVTSHVTRSYNLVSARKRSECGSERAIYTLGRKNYYSLRTMISPEPEVESRRNKRHFKEEASFFWSYFLECSAMLNNKYFFNSL